MLKPICLKDEVNSPLTCDLNQRCTNNPEGTLGTSVFHHQRMGDQLRVWLPFLDEVQGTGPQLHDKVTGGGHKIMHFAYEN